MRILHGENTIQSRNRLFALTAAARAEGTTITHLEAKSLDFAQLESALGGQSLFGENPVLVVEELHSLPKSKRKDELIEYLGSFSDAPHIILWEKRDLTPTMLKKFPTAQAEFFKLSSSLFAWLDKFASGSTQKNLELLQRSLASDGGGMCFAMLIRQIRLLIQAKEGSFAGMAPFMMSKLKSQAASFSIEKLLQLHHRLLTIDVAQKTSSAKRNLDQELELLIFEL